LVEELRFAGFSDRPTKGPPVVTQEEQDAADRRPKDSDGHRLPNRFCVQLKAEQHSHHDSVNERLDPRKRLAEETQREAGAEM